MQDKPVTTYEPCARVDGGINILHRGEVIWESPALDNDYDFENPAPNMDIKSDEWQDALLLCDALALLDKAGELGYKNGFKEGRS